MKLELNMILKGLDKKEMEKADPLSKILANQLATRTKKIEPIKAYDWAMSLFNEGQIDIDRSDCDNLIEEVKGLDSLSNLAKAQILLEIQKCTDKEKNNKKQHIEHRP